MEIIVEIPDEIAQRLNPSQGSLSRRVLETVVADAYRCGEISTGEVGKILQLSTQLEINAFLRHKGVDLNCDRAELEQDFDQLSKLKTSFLELVDQHSFKLPKHYQFNREELYDRNCLHRH